MILPGFFRLVHPALIGGLIAYQIEAALLLLNTAMASIMSWNFGFFDSRQSSESEASTAKIESFSTRLAWETPSSFKIRKNLNRFGSETFSRDSMPAISAVVSLSECAANTGFGNGVFGLYPVMIESVY
jgi:hypothetical protein